MMSAEQNNVTLPWRVLDADIRDEPDVRVPLIGEKGEEPLDPMETQALVEAADEAVQAESSNPVVVSGLPHFSSRPGG